METHIITGPTSLKPAVPKPESTAPLKRANRLAATKLNNKMVTAYWEDLFTAKEQGKLVCWYEGVAINPILQAAD